MKWYEKLLALLLVVSASSVQAAVKDHFVDYHLTVIQDDQVIHESHHQPFGFRVEVVNDDEGVKPETFKNGRPFITAAKDERYSVRLYNPLPVRVAVNLTVDGLNSITGKPSGIADGEKWMIEPYSSITIPGWQVNGGEARRFYFTDKHASYAKWEGDNMGKDLSANCGVIGAAYFWNKDELNAYYDNHPIYRYTQRPPLPYSNYFSRSKKCMSEIAPAPACASNGAAMDQEMRREVPQEQAGTGMGKTESNPTIQVAFDYNAGMYKPSQAVVIYYDFAKVQVPNPFPAIGYAPEMP